MEIEKKVTQSINISIKLTDADKIIRLVDSLILDFDYINDLYDFESKMARSYCIAHKIVPTKKHPMIQAYNKWLAYKKIRTSIELLQNYRLTGELRER